MATTLEVIYENGIFKPISPVPAEVKENEKIKIIIETDVDENLKREFADWEQASEEDSLKFEKILGVKA